MAFHPTCASDAPRPEPEPTEETYQPAPFWRLVMWSPALLFYICAFVTVGALLLGMHPHNHKAENCAVGYTLGYLGCYVRHLFLDLVYKR